MGLGAPREQDPRGVGIEVNAGRSGGGLDLTHGQLAGSARVRESALSAEVAFRDVRVKVLLRDLPGNEGRYGVIRRAGRCAHYAALEDADIGPGADAGLMS